MLEFSSDDSDLDLDPLVDIQEDDDDELLAIDRELEAQIKLYNLLSSGGLPEPQDIIDADNARSGVSTRPGLSKVTRPAELPRMGKVNLFPDFVAIRERVLSPQSHAASLASKEAPGSNASALSLVASSQAMPEETRFASTSTLSSSRGFKAIRPGPILNLSPSRSSQPSKLSIGTSTDDLGDNSGESFYFHMEPFQSTYIPPLSNVFDVQGESLVKQARSVLVKRKIRESLSAEALGKLAGTSLDLAVISFRRYSNAHI
jgi:hypothetical protein